MADLNLNVIRLKMTTKLTIDAVKDIYNFTEMHFSIGLDKNRKWRKKRTCLEEADPDYVQPSKKSKKSNGSSKSQPALKKSEMIEKVVKWCNKQRIPDFGYLLQLVEGGISKDVINLTTVVDEPDVVEPESDMPSKTLYYAGRERARTKYKKDHHLSENENCADVENSAPKKNHQKVEKKSNDVENENAQKKNVNAR